MSIRFDTVVIGAADVPALAGFYETVFFFRQKERSEAWQDPAGSIRMAVPGFRGHAPEFLFVPASAPAEPVNADCTGYAHICFETSNMWVSVQAILAAGGSMISRFANNEKEVALYLRDPEANIVELHVPLPEPFRIRVAAGTVAAVARAKLGLGRRAAGFRSRFLHVNIISEDWQRITDFYKTSFGSLQIGKHRDYRDEYIVKLTDMRSQVTVIGEHVSLPGNSDSITTVEVFTYTPLTVRRPLKMGDRGILALDFAADVADLSVVRKAGGLMVGENNGVQNWQDPDGNLFRFHSR